MYLTFDEYVAMGGSISDQTEYDRAEYKARSYIDYYTLYRTKSLAEIPEAVKRCVFEIVGVLQARDGSGAGFGVNSVSNDGVSMSYSGVADIERSVDAITRKIVRQYLSGETDANGTPFLYRGVE